MKKSFLIKIVYFILLLFVIIFSFYVALRNTPINLILRNKATIVNFLERVFGLIAFFLLSIQIIVGAFMDRLKKYFGEPIFNIHLLQGLLIYLIFLAHPFLYVVFNYFIKGIIDPFYVFTDVCVLCRNVFEIFLTLGRSAFWLGTLGIFAAILRKENWWRKYWKKIHLVNYLVFFLVVIHMRFLGTDTLSSPFKYFYYSAIILIIMTLIYKTRSKLFSK